MNAIWTMIKSLLLSRKFLTMIAGLLVAFAARWGLSLDETEVAGILAMFIAFILAQGQADKGKEAEKVRAIADIVNEQPKLSDDKIQTIKDA